MSRPVKAPPCPPTAGFAFAFVLAEEAEEEEENDDDGVDDNAALC